jgi:hypothetical protein
VQLFASKEMYEFSAKYYAGVLAEHGAAADAGGDTDGDDDTVVKTLNNDK